MMMLGSFFEAIAWQIDPPKAYGLIHIVFTLIGFAVCGVSAWKLKDVDDRTANTILFSCGLFLAITEVMKQFFCSYVIAEGHYNWGTFPFQLCSIPMYMCLIIPFLKHDQLKKALLDFMVLYNLLGGAISFAEPSGIFQEYLILTVHSCIWHMLLVFIGLFLCFSKRGGAEKWSYGSATWVFLTLCEIAFLLNSAVQLGLGENMNMFFVGPGNSPIIVFKQISEQFGWFINTPIYIFAVCLGAYLVFYLIQRISTCFEKFEPDPKEFTK